MTKAGAITLHGYFRSSATWRVRIGLALKGLAFDQITHDLRSGAQRNPAYLQLNPQGLVPALEIDGLVLTQSLAILDYLDERHPTPRLNGETMEQRARIRAFALAIACEIHPLQNLKVLKQISHLQGHSDAGADWARQINAQGMAMCAALLPEADGRFCFGDQPSLADILLIPQMANARRYGVDMVWDRLTRIEANCLALPAFSETAPDMQDQS